MDSGRDTLIRKAVLQVLRASLLLLLVLVAGMVQRQHSAAQAPTTLGVDPQTTGNTGTSIASVEDCTAVDIGDTFEVDIYITDVEELRAWELRFAFDHQVVQIVNNDFGLFLLSTTPSGSIFPSLFVEEKPDRYFLGASEYNGTPDSGSGVLARLTMQALAPGRSPALIVSEPSYFRPLLTDSNGANTFNGTIHQAEIAVGEPCSQPAPTPPSASPTPPPSETPLPGTPVPTPSPSGEGQQVAGAASEASFVSAIPPSLPGLTDSVIFTAWAGLLERDATAEPATTPVALAEESTPAATGTTAAATGTTPAAGGSAPPSGGDGDGPPLWLLASLGLVFVAAGAGGLLAIKSVRRSNHVR